MTVTTIIILLMPILVVLPFIIGKKIEASQAKNVLTGILWAIVLIVFVYLVVAMN
jgi:hypothetical protein